MASSSLQTNICSENKQRSSNLELFRIICMLMIMAHHYVLSGFVGNEGPLVTDPVSPNSMFLWLFGAWGKTGMNCFIMITGYFMCTSKITARKFVKFISQVYFYRFILFFIFLLTGYEIFSGMRLIKLVMPFWGLTSGFVSCFIVFYITIPFWNILIHSMDKRQHALLLLLLLVSYTFLGSIPTFKVSFNYITWFGIIYLIASYIRLYPQPIFERRKLWAGLTLILVLFAMVSVFVLQKMMGAGYFLLSDCNKFFAVAIAVSSFLWFKNMNIKYSKFINAFGAATFGVLLIHANSDAMRLWLWTDVVDAAGHYHLPVIQLALFCVGVVLAVFITCNIIDQLRIATVEKSFLKWYDKHIDNKLNKLIKSE